MFARNTQEPGTQGTRTPNDSKHPWVAPGGQSTRSLKQDWEKLYRAAVFESDRSKLRQRIQNAEAAILERSRSLSKAPGDPGKEQDAIARALHILSLLREAGQEPGGKRSAPP
jgi:hypothetical protein